MTFSLLANLELGRQLPGTLYSCVARRVIDAAAVPPAQYSAPGRALLWWSPVAEDGPPGMDLPGGAAEIAESKMAINMGRRRNKWLKG